MLLPAFSCDSRPAAQARAGTLLGERDGGLARKVPRSLLWPLLAAAAAAAIWLASARRGAPPTEGAPLARLLPRDTLAYLSIPDAARFARHLRASAPGRIASDPASRAYLAALRRATAGAWRGFWTDVELIRLAFAAAASGEIAIVLQEAWNSDSLFEIAFVIEIKGREERARALETAIRRMLAGDLWQLEPEAAEVHGREYARYRGSTLILHRTTAALGRVGPYLVVSFFGEGTIRSIAARLGGERADALVSHPPYREHAASLPADADATLFANARGLWRDLSWNDPLGLGRVECITGALEYGNGAEPGAQAAPGLWRDRLAFHPRKEAPARRRIPARTLFEMVEGLGADDAAGAAARFPAETVACLAWGLDLGDLWALVRSFEPPTSGEIDLTWAGWVEANLGFAPDEDAFRAAGGSGALAVETAGTLLLPRVDLVLRVRDAEKAGRIAERAFHRRLASDGLGELQESFVYESRRITWVDRKSELVRSPAFAVDGGELVASTQLAGLKRLLKRSGARLAGVGKFREIGARPGRGQRPERGAALLLYLDLEILAQRAYPLAALGLRALAGGMPAPAPPPAEVLAREVRAAAGSARAAARARVRAGEAAEGTGGAVVVESEGPVSLWLVVTGLSFVPEMPGLFAGEAPPGGPMPEGTP